MQLLERQAHLDTLNALLRDAGTGKGSVALLGGEAGAGKSSLARAFAVQSEATARVATGACDAIAMPRPLGPFFDVAPALGLDIRPAIHGASERAAVFDLVLGALADSSRPTLVILEDLHWADDATIDLLRYLGRRIEHLPAMIVVTFRDDEISAAHPLRIVLGDLATLRTVRRLKVANLSANAVATLASGTGIDPDQLHRDTGGNPFYVTEVLAAGTMTVPQSVGDAVLARSARLSERGRTALQVASVIGDTVDTWLLAEAASDCADAIDECLEVGLMVPDGETIRFRHHLGQEVIYRSLSPMRRRSLHESILTALLRRQTTAVDDALVVHHADAAGNGEVVLSHAPRAARQASSVGSHRAAVALYDTALRYADRLPDPELRALRERLFEECWATGQHERSLAILGELIASAEATGDRIREALWLSRLAMVLVNDGRNQEANEAMDRAIALLGTTPEGPTHALVYQMQARIRMLDRDYDQAIAWGSRASSLARGYDDTQTLVGALNAVGSSLVIRGDEDEGRARLEEGLAAALGASLDLEAASLFTNLGSAHGEVYRFDLADRYLEDGVAFTRQRDLDGWYWYQVAWLALVRMYRGRLREAADLAANVLRTPAGDGISRIMALIALGRVRARRGDPDVWTALDEALDLARPTQTLQRLAPCHAARAEAAWLAGNHALSLAEARAIYPMAVVHDHPWHIGELGYWRWKCGDIDTLPDSAAMPWRLQIAGDASGAARAWMERGCPYESARALAESDEETSLRRAFAIFDDLGAKPAAAMVTRRLRELGVPAIPRGRRPTTRQNVANLTSRESEVMELVRQGLTNREIAERLYLSAKTIEHHMTAILAKLGASSRQEAIERFTSPASIRDR